MTKILQTKFCPIMQTRTFSYKKQAYLICVWNIAVFHQVLPISGNFLTESIKQLTTD